MEYVLPLAAKSLLFAGGTLLLLQLMHKRSSSDRSWVAHLGLFAILLLPVGTLVLPALKVAGPAYLSTESVAPSQTSALQVAEVGAAPEVATTAKPFPEPQADESAAGFLKWAFWIYAAPAGLLLLLTLIALARLTVLKRRAKVLVDAAWLQALARAQHRMGFKNGTALLTSNELRSPISWGLMRPVILLNTDATEARDEAEAIIAHELAHVAGLDWAKLMLSRVAVALFWFNPLVWLLAREAHQLREEAADDAVLAANIEDTEYANLLVGIARHECRGLLLGAHGVAPGKDSLKRRVKRVLDAALDRAPGGWKWSSAAAFFAAGMTVPAAALQFVSPATAASELPSRAPKFAEESAPERKAAVASFIASQSGQTVIASADGNRAMIAGSGSPDKPVGAAIATAVAQAGAAAGEAESAVDRAVELKAVGGSPAYARAIRDAAPNLHLTHDDIVGLAALHVSPNYIRDLAASGLRDLSVDDIEQARSLGIDGAYARGMASAGFAGLSMDDLSALKAVGISPAEAARYRRTGRGLPSVDAMVAAKASGLRPEDIDPYNSE